MNVRQPVFIHHPAIRIGQQATPMPAAGWSSNLAPPQGQGAATGLLGSPMNDFWAALSVAGIGLGAYHGYARNGTVGWALAWAALGGLFPIITIPVALAQGLGRPA